MSARCFWQIGRRLGASGVFTQLMERWWGRIRCALKSIGYFFYARNRRPSNISMNRTVEQLAENSGEKKELFKELN